MFPMKTTDGFPPLDYWENFVMASEGENEDLGGILPLIGQSYFLGASGVPQEGLNESLAYMMPEIRPINVSASFENLSVIERCDCVSFIKEFFSGLKGKQLFYPEYVWNNFEKYNLEKTEPQVGALVILINHIAVVSKDLGNEIEIVEKNQIPCVTGRRIIPKDYEKIIGFLK